MTKLGTRVIPIGGVGEFGANATIIQTQTTTVLVDFGIMFPPNERQPGVEFYLNDPDELFEIFPELSALFVTHAHEDHIGAIPFLLRKKNLPVFTMPYTAAMIQKSCEYLKIKPDLHKVKLNTPVSKGDISVEFVGVTHSICEACALYIKTPAGTLVHSGDFKVDAVPQDNHPFQTERFMEIGREGVDLLLMDSTNATRNGFCPSDIEIVPHIEKAVETAPGRVFFTTFSSHMPRLKKLKRVAIRTGRMIVLIGRGFQKHFDITQETKYMERMSQVFANPSYASRLPDNRLIYVVTGSQAEQQSALARIERGEHRDVSLKSGDRVIFSSKPIPGNERHLALMASGMEQKGIEVITAKDAYVHTSGHGYREDITYMMRLTQPKTVVPIHGEFHQLKSHFEWLKEMVSPGTDYLLIEDGDILEMTSEGVNKRGFIETSLIPIDGTRNLAIPPEVIRDRKSVMYNGLVFIHGVVNENERSFQVSTSCMVESHEGEMADRIYHVLDDLLFNEDEPLESWGNQIVRNTRRCLKRIFYGRPLVKLILNGKVLS